jgi:hypothetical protein
MNQADGAAGVQAWIDGVKPEHRLLAKRVDALIVKTIPGVRRAIKWRKPSQPLGVPFYGLPDQGWIVAMWSFKDSLGVGFIAGTLLDPKPPVLPVRVPSALVGTRSLGPGAFQTLQERLIARMAAQRGEVRIMLNPLLVGPAVFDSTLEAIKGPVDLPLQGIHTSDCVERHGLFRVDRQGAAGPLQSPRRFIDSTPEDGAHMEGAGIVGV